MASGSIHRRDLHLIMVVTVTVLRTCAPCPSVCDCQRYSTQKGIDCDGKDLDTVPAGIPADTRFLRLEHNRLTRLPADVFSGLSLLIQLTLYNNQIADIEDGAFRDLVRLRKLHLESNNISLLTNHTFEGVPNLEELILRNNRLSSLPSGVFSQVHSLVELDLAHNGIRDFPTDVSQDLRNVQMLDLSSNPAGLISTAIFEHMVALQQIKLSSLIGISEIDLSGLAFDGLGNLVTLNLDGNHLNKVPTAIRSLSNLTSLDIHSNAIEMLNADDFYHPSLLEYLNLNDNQLTEIPTAALAQLPHLTTVFLDGNPISVISARAFWHNPRLSILSLADTNLTTIDADAFTGLSQLGTLYLQGNNLTTIVNGAMNSVNPNVYLLLTGNPLRCDCNLREFAAWLKNNHTGTLSGGSSLKCATPDRLRSSPLDDLNPNQFACEPRTTFPTTKVISVFMGKEVLLPCEIEADPVVDIFWITSSHATVHPDQPQPPFALADNGSLFVSTVNLIHEGLYTCVVSNDAGEVRNSVKLRVLRLPDLGSRQTPTIEHGTHTPTDSSDRLNTSATMIVGVVFSVAVVFVVVIVGVSIYRKRRRKAATEYWESSTRTFDSEDEFNELGYQSGGSLPSGNAPEPPQRPGAGNLTGPAGVTYVNESLSESLSLDESYETRITPNEEAQWPLYEEIEDSRDDENSEASLKPQDNTDVDQQGHQHEELAASVKQQRPGLDAVADVQQQHPDRSPAAKLQQQHPDGWQAANVQQHPDGGPMNDYGFVENMKPSPDKRVQTMPLSTVIPPSRPFSLSLLMTGLLIFSQGTHSICPSVCRCNSYVTVRCGYQSLTAIPVGLPSDARILYLEYNQLTKLAAGDFSDFSQLQEIYLYNNRISEIEDYAFRGLRSLRKLRLGSNNISTLTNRTFEGIPNLEELNLRNNRLSSLPSGVFSPIPQLLKLDLAVNSIGELLTDSSPDLRNVRMLDLSSNPASLISMTVFEHMVALEVLKLNYLNGINSAFLNGLFGLAFDRLTNLLTLELVGNQFNSIPSAIKSLPNLTSVSLQLNSIETINADDFHQPSFLQFLNLDDNKLTDIPTAALAQLPYLTDLYVDYNPISMIPAQAFFHNPRLSILSVAYTNLTTIEEDAFAGLTQLSTLFLQGNNLTTVVNGAMKSVKSNVNLQFSGNPLRCDCNLRGFATWLKNNHTGTLNGGRSLDCVTPDRLRGVSVKGLHHNQFACTPRSTSASPTTKVISIPLDEEVFLPCDIEADPRQVIFWITKNHASISPDQPQPPFAIAGNDLLITNVSFAHEGLYTCVVSNDAGEARHTVILQVASTPTVVGSTIRIRSEPTSPTVGDGMKITVASTGRKAETRQPNGLMFGVTGAVLAIVVVAVIIAVVVVRQRKHSPKPYKRDIPLPPIPPMASAGQLNTPLDLCSADEGAYAEIPADRISFCEASGYSTRINEPGSDHPPSTIEHTYLSSIKDNSHSKCDPELKDKPLTVTLPEERYSSLPSSSSAAGADDGYLFMKSLSK
ncbi:uncharacterized protein LOC110975875 [Acanthaster planci]|uniref:Uncharacterized protein LOC110975875 n=1 Tax=Acanthaster planci TaxID=133434 RepID=A0A8B7XU93_ACAPL|nr:uncharacterized protein LOC110975875 [Acanthaster planci]